MAEEKHPVDGGDHLRLVEREVMVTDQTGFHFLPASQMAKFAVEEFEGTIEAEKDGQRVNARSAMKLVGLLALPEKDLKFRIIIRGEGAPEAFEKLMKILDGQIVVVEPPAKKGSQGPKTRDGWAYRWNSFWSKG